MINRLWRITRTPGFTRNHPRSARGMALVVALVFLLLLTILGVTVMNTSALEGRMAGNTQETNRAFQAAESAIERVITDATAISNLAKPGDTNTSTIKYPTTDPYATVTVNVEYKQILPTGGRSKDLTQITSNPRYDRAMIVVNSNATTNSQAKTTVMQGIEQYKPAY